jgi:hypothetical protein
MSLLGLSTAGHFGDTGEIINNYTLPLAGTIETTELTGTVEVTELTGVVEC